MTPPRTRTGRSLVGLTLVLLGLSTYGCGDTGTSTEPAELGSLSVSPGSLQPAFNPATTSYTATVSSNVSSTTITASPRVAGDRIQIDNQQTTSQTIALESPGTEKSVNIVVTETGTGGTSRSYTIRVKREVEDTTLATLSVSSGTLAPSTFDKDTPDYTVNDIGNGVTSITISATKSNPNTVMQIDSVTVPAGTPSGQATVRLGAPGSTTKVSITVTAQGGSKNTYTVIINRGASDNSFLRSLSISSGSTALSLVPRFSQASPDYTVNVASSIGSTSVTARLDDATARMTVNGVDTNSGQARTITLNPASPNPSPTPILIVVTAQNGSRRTYSVNVIRAALGGNNNLSALTIRPGSLDFRADTLTYTVNVGSGVPSVAVSATKTDRNATMSQDVTAPAGTATGQATISLGNPGSTTPVVINVIAPNGTPKTYRINVVKDALGGNNNLSALTISPGSLDFKTDTLAYTVNVGNTVPSVNVSATKADLNATMSEDVTAQPGTATGRATISLVSGAGSTTPILITVIAPNGTPKTYRINVVKDALGGNNNLLSLTVPSHTLTPPFSQTRTRTDYDLEVNSSADSITVSATPQDSGASVRLLINNAPSTNPISLPPGPSTTEIEIIVRAPNAAEKSYFITVTRTAPSSNANLSALSVTAGTAVTPLSSPFDSNTVTVAPEVGEVLVRATKDDVNATMAIGANTIAPGTTSGQSNFTLNGAGGDPTPISFTVTAQNGVDIKTYTISVIRPAAPTKPPTPKVAPDLIAADDSCTPNLPPNENTCFDPLPPATNSHEDNITNVTKPGFTISQPAAGETPNLYVGTTKYTFAPGTTTLRPTVDLADGVYAITYTLTNAVDESDPSPTLTVTIDTSAPVR